MFLPWRFVLLTGGVCEWFKATSIYKKISSNLQQWKSWSRTVPTSSSRKTSSLNPGKRTSVWSTSSPLRQPSIYPDHRERSIRYRLQSQAQAAAPHLSRCQAHCQKTSKEPRDLAELSVDNAEAGPPDGGKAVLVFLGREEHLSSRGVSGWSHSFCEGGELFERLEKNGQFDENSAR